MTTHEISFPATPPERSLPLWRQLRWILVLSFVALTALPMLIVMAFTLSQMEIQAQKQVFNQLESVAELKTHQINRWLNDSNNVLRLLSHEIKRDGNAGILPRLPANPVAQEKLDGFLRETLSNQQIFESLFIYTLDGRVVAASHSARLDRIMTHQPYFAQSLQNPYVQPPYYAVGSSKLTMVLTQPLVDEDGETTGVLAGELNLTDLSAIMLERSGLGETGETYLVSSENNYLLTPSRFENYSLNHAYHSEGIDHALQGKDGFGIFSDYRTPPTPVFSVYRWVPELQAAMLAEQDVAEALEPAAHTRTISLTLAVAATLLAIAFGLYTAARVSSPILTLTQVALRITNGDLSQQASITAHSEIGVLSRSFNAMTSHLRATLEGLEQRVAERTLELERTVVELRESLNQRDLLNATVRELSSPVMPIQPGVLVMPLIGIIDSDRSLLLTESLLKAIEQHHAHTVIVDVTGVPVVDTQVGQTLIQAATAARLLGAQAILVGIRPDLAQSIVHLGVEFSHLVTRADLQSGVSYALQAKQRTRQRMRQ